MPKVRIGLIGLIQDEAEKDFWGTMQKVAEIGYQGIEEGMKLLEGDVKSNMERFHGLGLSVAAVGTSREQLRDDLESLIGKAKALETKRATVWWSGCGTREEILRDAELYNSSGARLAAEGLTLCYHNHEHEFLKIFNGVNALEILAEHTDPRYLSFELDIAWATFGGEDPVRLLKKMEGRIPAIHVKDLYGLQIRDQFTAVGTGAVKVREAMLAAADTGVEWAIVEQDRLRNLTSLETITLSYLYLKENGLA